MERGKSASFLAFVAACLFLLLCAFAHQAWRAREDRAAREERRAMVRALGITDLCLFTDARYTRHPAVADRFAPFQDHPSSLEHFPSASLLPVPPRLRRP